jgi:hypothetical protein
LQAAEKDVVDVSTKRSHDERASSLNANQVLILHSRLKIIQARVAQENKAALEVREVKGLASHPNRGDRSTTATQESTH